MDLWSAIFTVLRRWYVALPILVASIAAAFVVGGRIEPEYKAEAAIAFKAPEPIVREGQIQPFRNPYASDPKTLAALTIRGVRSEGTRLDFEAQGLSPDYEVSLDQFTAVMDFVVVGNSDAQAIDTADALLDATKRKANKIQAGDYEGEEVTFQDLPADQAVKQAGSKPRVMASLVLLGIVGAAGSAFVLESLSNRRKGIGPVVGQASGQAPGFPGGYIQVVQVPANAVTVPAEVPAPVANGHAELFEDDVDLDALLEDIEPEPVRQPRKAAPAANGRGKASGQEINRGKSRKSERPRHDAEDDAIDLSADPDPARAPAPALSSAAVVEPELVVVDDLPELSDEPDVLASTSEATAAEAPPERAPAERAPAERAPAAKPARATKGAASGHNRPSTRTNRSRRTSLFATDAAESAVSGDDANDGD